MSTGDTCSRKQEAKKRLVKRANGEYNRCPNCGRIGLSMYLFDNAIYYGFFHTSKFIRERKKIDGVRYCRTCDIEYDTNGGDKPC